MDWEGVSVRGGVPVGVFVSMGVPEGVVFGGGERVGETLILRETEAVFDRELVLEGVSNGVGGLEGVVVGV